MKDWKLKEIIINVGASEGGAEVLGEDERSTLEARTFWRRPAAKFLLLLKVPLNLIYLLKHVLNYLHIEATRTTESGVVSLKRRFWHKNIPVVITFIQSTQQIH